MLKLLEEEEIGWLTLVDGSNELFEGGMTAAGLKSWRKAERDRLIAARESLDAATLERLRQRIDAHLWRSFPGLTSATLAFCWPIRGEYDARRLAQKLRECGAVTALPVVVAPRQPLVFREWHPGVALASGPLGIPYPVGSDPVVPTNDLPDSGSPEGAPPCRAPSLLTGSRKVTSPLVCSARKLW